MLWEELFRLFSHALCLPLQYIFWSFPQFLFHLGREDPHSMDSTWSNCLPQIHICQWCLELRHCNVGGDVLWREALLGNDKPRCKHVPELLCDGTLRAQHSFCYLRGRMGTRGGELLYKQFCSLMPDRNDPPIWCSFFLQQPRTGCVQREMCLHRGKPASPSRPLELL